MPKKLTPEQIEANYNAYRESPEYMCIEELMVERRNITPVEMSTKDIWDVWSKFLDALFKLT